MQAGYVSMSMFMVQRAISVRSVFSQLMAVAISATLVLFQPWARIVMRPPWPAKVCEEGPVAATATGGQTYNEFISDLIFWFM